MRTGTQVARKHGHAARRGLAMVAVLLVLMALFVLSAPFLVTVRNADQASAESADRSVLRISLDAAARHAAAGLAGSHPALDATPYFDDLDELTVTSRFPKEFLATDDPSQVMWDLEAEDVAAKVDLSSASPHVLANLIGGAGRLSATCTEKDSALEVSASEGFLPEGVVLVDDELMGYAELGPSKLGKLARGLLVQFDAEGKPLDCGPTPPAGHEVGAFVIDQRAWALCEWRIATGKLRAYEGIEQVREAKDFVLAPELGREAYLALARSTSTFGHVRAGARWQRAARVVSDPSGLPQYGCKLAVDDLRWFNPGTTVWITDGTNSELALVRKAESGVLVLTKPLQVPFEAHETIVAPLARTPVNVNTAPPEVLKALWTNLKLRGKSARITAGEAEQLVDLALVSRPFTGFEDFLRRLVLPAGGLDELPADAPVRPEALEELARDAKLDAQGVKTLVGFLDADDARALYKNALNANDNELEFATMPLCFTSRDVYELALRAAVNAPSGIQRARGSRELTELIVPQRDLLSVWTRQEDFDDAPRLDRAAAGWLSGPVPTSRHDPAYGEVSSLRWPTRTRAHLGPHDTQPTLDPLGDDANVYAFAQRDNEDGWAQLAAAREEDSARKASYALHFDDETQSLEGRYLPDGTAPLDLAKLGWTGAAAVTGGGITGSTSGSAGSAGLMSGMACSLWVKPRELEEGARLLDVTGAYKDSDRLSLLFEGGNLVLRVLDGAGDHPSSTFKEQAEVRFALTGEGPGLPLDTWSHVQIAVDGSRPDQMALWVDGRKSGRTPGLTRLTASLSDQSDTLAVESTEGFPDKCVVRIGNELIEVLKKGERSFLAKFQSTGENAGFGGRIAREIHSGYPEQNDGLNKFTDHAAGSSVQLYGYSTPLFSNVPNVAGNLRDELALFAVARVVGTVVDGSEKTQTSMEAITPQGYGVSVGHGFDGKGEDLDGLILESVDPGRSIEDTMSAFSQTGGYAAVMSTLYTDGTQANGHLQDINGNRIGGIEVIRYSGWEGTTLNITQRGPAGLTRLQGKVRPEVADRGAFIAYYALPPGWTYTGPTSLEQRNEELHYQVMVIPISVPSNAPSSVTGFEQANNGSSFAQITHSGGDAHLTEWFRYDEISIERLFVRDDPDALVAAYNAAIFQGDPLTSPTRENEIVRDEIRAGVPEPKTARAASVPGASPPPRQQHGGGSFWDYLMGEEEGEEFPVARSVNSHFQFRGVLGTFQHVHPQGQLILPVFRLRNFDETAGWPGRFDHVMFMSDLTDEPGFPGVVHRAHRPFQYLKYDWREGGEALTAEAVEGATPETQSGFQSSLTHVALEDRLAVPFTPVPINDASGNVKDTRILTRMVLFPSGELPRQVQRGQLGGDVLARATVPSTFVDEALFFPSLFGSLAGMPGQLVLAQALAESAKTFTALKETVRTPLGDYPVDYDPLANLPKNGGLVRIGDELLCYDTYDASGNSYSFTIPPAGRGLLGTEARAHRPTEGITFHGSLPVGILAANLRPDDALVRLTDTPSGFPSQGTVRIEDELVHYTRHDSGILEMPRASSEPGEMDRKGPGLFRGRFGTARAAHVSGTPVILFPFRYWDRWSELADAPEMTYYELSLDQPDAYWKRVFWKAGDAGHPGPELGVLQRTNPETPWDAAPEDKNGLTLLRHGKLDADGNPIDVQADRVEWRVFVRHLPGSFDALEGLAHGWKESPRLELFGVEYMGPGRTLARADR